MLKNFLILLLLIYVLIASGESDAKDLCNRNEDQVIIDNENNVVCASPFYKECDGPAIVLYEDDIECLDINTKEFLSLYKLTTRAHKTNAQTTKEN